MTIVNNNRHRHHLKSFPALVATLILTIACYAVGQSFPPTAQAETFSAPEFTSEVVTTLPPFLPVGVTWASDGRMFIWQRNGVIRIYKNGQLLATPFLDISDNVNTFDDRGMLGLALHPNFMVNGYVYVIYVREDGGDTNDSSPKIARLSRFMADPQNPDVALSNSETILFTIPNDFHHHVHGTLRFGPDGKLFMGHGDDAQVLPMSSPLSRKTSTICAEKFCASMRTAPPRAIIRSTTAPIRSSRKSIPMDSAIPFVSPSIQSPENPILETWGGTAGKNSAEDVAKTSAGLAMKG